MTDTIIRRTRGLIVVAVLALGLAACSSDDSAEVTDTVEDAAAEAGEAADDAIDEVEDVAGDAVDAIDAAAYTVSLSGDAEVPGPGAPDGSGDAAVTITGNDVCAAGQYEGAEALTAGHIHAGTAEESGDVVVDLGITTDGSGAFTSCGEGDDATIEAITSDPDAFYLNLHTEEFPAGAIRGQLG